MTIGNRYSPEVQEHVVQLVAEQRSEHESQWAAICIVISKIGYTTKTLRRWVRQTEWDKGERAGLTSDERARLKELERENRELRKATEIVRLALAYFAKGELKRKQKS